MDRKRWLFSARVLDKAGTVRTTSSVFSNRGVSMQMLLGSTLQVAAGEGIPMFFVFEAAEPKMKSLLRVMRRLACVISAECVAYDSPLLRAIALVQVDRQEPGGAADVPAVAAEKSVAATSIVGEGRQETWILMGLPSDVEACIQRLRQAGIVRRTTMTVMPAV